MRASSRVEPGIFTPNRARAAVIGLIALGLATTAACKADDDLRYPDSNPTDPTDECPYGPPGGPKVEEAACPDIEQTTTGCAMSEVVEGSEPPESLTFIRKPRLLEKHKGGRIWFEGDLGDKGLVSWVHSAVDETSCEEELIKP